MDCEEMLWTCRRVNQGKNGCDGGMFLVLHFMPKYFSQFSLQTHNAALMGPLSDFVVSMHDGKVHKRGLLKDVLEEDIDLVQQLKHDEDELQREQEAVREEQTEVTAAEKKSTGKLIVAEEIPLGHVSRDASKHSCLFGHSYSNTLHSILVFQGARGEALHHHRINVPVLHDTGERYHCSSVMVPRVLGFAVHRSFSGCPSVPVCPSPSHLLSVILIFVPRYLFGYGELCVRRLFYNSLVSLAALVILTMTFVSATFATYVYAVLRASASIHYHLMDSILHTTLRFVFTMAT
jgi:hypothetical protein